ncbi:MAG: CoA transferase [Comamonas sp.]
MNYPHLQGLRVIESSAFIAAPLAGLTLAQFGAEVIRVDLIGGGIDYARMPTAPSGRSLYWTALNKDKKSVAIDIRKPEGRELVQQLVAAPGPQSGVLLTNIGTPWLSHAVLAGLRQDVITCTIEGNNDASTAVDYTVNCATGYPQSTDTGNGPVNSVFPGWDFACAYQAAFAITSAYLRRTQTGQGAELRLALSDVAFSALSHMGVMTEAELFQRDRPPIGNHIYGAFGHDFATSDGRRVMVAGISAGQWRSLVKTCAIEAAIASFEQAHACDLAREEDRFVHRDAVVEMLAPWFASRTFAAACAALDAGKVCWGPYRTVTQLLDEDPRVGAANPIFDRVETSGIGAHWAAGTPIRHIGQERGLTQPARLLGQDTDEVLSRVLGLADHQIARLHDQRVVAGPEQDPTASAANR